ncbi:hypothetical protein ACG3SK_13655 [Pseudomonas aeruginosa]
MDTAWRSAPGGTIIRACTAAQQGALAGTGIALGQQLGHFQGNRRGIFRHAWPEADQLRLRQTLTQYLLDGRVQSLERNSLFRHG